MLGLHDEPDSLYGIVIGRIGRKIKRFEKMPVELLSFVPGGVVEDKDVPFSSRCNAFCHFIEEDLENLRVAMTCLNGAALCANISETLPTQ